MLPLKKGKAVSKGKRGRAELTQPWADTSESWSSALSRSFCGCGGDNLGSTPRSVAAARRELASAASPAQWNSPRLNSTQRGWVQTLGAGAVSAKLWPQAGWEGKMSGQRRWDYLAKELPSSQTAPEKGRTLHTMHPGRATSLLSASFSVCSEQHRQGREAIGSLGEGLTSSWMR